MKTPYFKNPPIVEALVDIKVELDKQFVVSNFLNIKDSFKKDYPDIQEIWRHHAQINVKNQNVSETQNSDEQIGFFYKSKDKDKLFQFRVDGFTFNQLRPYSSWEKMINEAKEKWEIYKSVCGFVKIVRVAVRYINHIPVQIPISNYDKYFYFYPILPSGFPPVLNNFLINLNSVDPNSQIISNVILTLDKKTPSREVFILDIDVFKNIKPDDGDIWLIFQKLHEQKNNIFFHTIKKRTMEVFK